MQPDNSKVPGNYIDWLLDVERIFGSAEPIASASKEELTEGLSGKDEFEIPSHRSKDESYAAALR